MTYIHFIGRGVIELADGLFVTAGIQDQLARTSWQAEVANGMLFVGMGFGWLIPVLIVVGVGRVKLYRMAGRRLDRCPERNQRAGVFVSSLLESVVVEVGDPWWLLKGDDNLGKCWRQGEVTEVLEDSIRVRMDKRYGLHRSSSSLSRRSSRNDCYIEEVPLRKSQFCIKELAAEARRHLRCVDWTRTTAPPRSISAMYASTTTSRASGNEI